ncbi:DUF4123 domain-containing protein [Pseudomonas zhanjiangensis]|uniref:DUF4123 domain-containing protein n=1 Tax=Pseudomonas zhanjiangensis TaxID=3239015 RepID=A0ABV3YU46_9PSED
MNYLLLDGAQIDGLLARLYSLEETPVVYLLYQQTAYEALADVGAVLIALNPNSELAQVFDQEWRTSAGIWLESDDEPEALVEHLRSLVHARVDGAVTVLLRYYDPRITPLWLGSMQPEQRDTVLGPVSRIRLPDETGGEQLFQREISPHSVARYTDTPWLRLTQAQLEHMNQAKQACFDQRLLTHLQRYYPECMDGLDAPQQQQWAAQCRKSAAHYGYSSAANVIRWACLCAELGNDFPQAPEHAAYRQLLEQRGQLPAQRLDNLITELHRQLLRADKESVA